MVRHIQMHRIWRLLPKIHRELGIVRKRTSASLASKTHNFKRTGQIFCYLVVLDFESTCWEDRRNIPQEIIEFPAVLLNTSTGQIEREFQHYVQPQEKPVLSDFCRQLTGITQEQVDEGIPLNLCLSRFSHWLQKVAQEKNVSYNTAGPAGSSRCTFVTWSDWDLGVCLEFESRRKQLRRLAPLYSWIDLRATYRKFYSRRPSGLNGALLDLGIAFEGRQHSGLDDARNTAKLAWRMICDGCLMTITKTLAPSWRGQSCIGRSLPPPPLVTSTTVNKMTGRQTRQHDDVLSPDKCSDKKRDSGNAAVKPAVSVVRPAVSVMRPASGHAAVKPAVSVVRPASGHAAVKPAVSVARPASGHAAVKPAVSVVRPASGHTAAKPVVTVVRPDCRNAAVKPAVSIVRPDSCYAAIKPTVSVVRSGSGHTTAKPQLSVPRNNHTNTHDYSMPAFTSLKPSYAKTSASNQTKSRPAFSPRTFLTCVPTAVSTAPSSTLTSHQGRKQTGFQVHSPPAEQKKSSVGVTLTTAAPRDITNLPDAIFASAAETSSNASFRVSHVFCKPVGSPACGSYYVESTPSPNDSDIENDVQRCRFKTPSITPKASEGCSLKTPFITPDTGGGRLLKTPPLCRCGRRCKRNYVQSPGANVGRSFFCCPMGRRSAGSEKSPTGCGFFQWEQTAVKRRHTSSPASFSGGSTSKSVRFSPSSNLLPQPNFDTPGSEVKASRYNRDGRCLR